MRRVRRATGVAIALLALATSARAESIQITSGALVWSAAERDSVTLVGQAFTFDGVPQSTGIFMPHFNCQVPECVEGSSVDLRARWVGLDLPGTATYEGTTYTRVGGLVSDTSMDAIWDGTLSIPTGFDGGVLTAPFSFSGGFFIAGEGMVNLYGTGTASLEFRPYSEFDPTLFPGAFLVTSATYEFGDAAVPEPMSLVLVGTGLAGLAGWRRRRNLRR